MSEYNILLEKIEKHKVSHPNLYQIWRAYLINKKKEHDKLLSQFNFIFNDLENYSDISNDLIPKIYFYLLVTNSINT